MGLGRDRTAQIRNVGWVGGLRFSIHAWLDGGICDGRDTAWLV
jgi:hypothetical protein